MVPLEPLEQSFGRSREVGACASPRSEKEFEHTTYIFQHHIFHFRKIFVQSCCLPIAVEAL